MWIIYRMTGNICSNYIVHFYCQTVWFLFADLICTIGQVCGFNLCECPIIARANNFYLCGCAFGNLSSSSTGEVPTSFGCTILSGVFTDCNSFLGSYSFFESQWHLCFSAFFTNSSMTFSLAVRDDGLAVALCHCLSRSKPLMIFFCAHVLMLPWVLRPNNFN